MEDGLDVLGIGIEQKGAVVAGVVFGALARGAVGGVAGRDPCSVERVDGFLVGGLEGEVDFSVGCPSTIEKVAPEPRIWVRPS